jgi:transcriptional/translational regulatory protein YebC/TACO1
VSWDYTRLGAIEASPPPGGADADEAAIESGAQDLESDGEGGTVFYTEPTDLDAVSKALGERKWTVSSAKMIWKPKNPVTTLDAAQRAEVEAFLSDIDEDDDVQAIYPALG